jgi:hypothetical protein
VPTRDLTSINQRLASLRRQLEQPDDLGGDQSSKLNQRVLTSVLQLVRVHTHVPR